MERKKIRTEVGESQTFDAESWMQTPTLIDEVLEWLNEVKQKGATHISWNARTDYDGCSSEVEAQAYFEEEESDEDFLARQEQERLNREREQARALFFEKQQYEFLKAKFEGK